MSGQGLAHSFLSFIVANSCFEIFICRSDCCARISVNWLWKTPAKPNAYASWRAGSAQRPQDLGCISGRNNEQRLLMTCASDFKTVCNKGLALYLLWHLSFPWSATARKYAKKKAASFSCIDECNISVLFTSHLFIVAESAEWTAAGYRWLRVFGSPPCTGYMLSECYGFRITTCYLWPNFSFFVAELFILCNALNFWVAWYCILLRLVSGVNQFSKLV